MENDALMTVRRFGMLDGMILVAASAVGLGMLRAFSPEADWVAILGRVISPMDWSQGPVGDIVSDLVSLATPLLVVASLMVLAMRLRRPRPSWRRLARRPGWVACQAPILGWVFGVVFASAALSKGPEKFRRIGSPGLWIEAFSLGGSLLGGFGVLVAWLTLLLIRRWRPEPSWVDRLGRIVGVSWIALGFLSGYALFWQVL